MNDVSRLDDILMVQLSEVFDFAYGRHIEPILKLADFYFLNSNFPTSSNFASYSELETH